MAGPITSTQASATIAQLQESYTEKVSNTATQNFQGYQRGEMSWDDMVDANKIAEKSWKTDAASQLHLQDSADRDTLFRELNKSYPNSAGSGSKWKEGEAAIANPGLQTQASPPGTPPASRDADVSVQMMRDMMMGAGSRADGHDAAPSDGGFPTTKNTI